VRWRSMWRPSCGVITRWLVAGLERSSDALFLYTLAITIEV